MSYEFQAYAKATRNAQSLSDEWRVKVMKDIKALLTNFYSGSSKQIYCKVHHKTVSAQ